MAGLRKHIFVLERESMIPKSDEKILIFSSREICYLSGNFFANQIGGAFEELGFPVEVCELAKEDSLDEKLEVFMGKKYKLILDFNSLLPRMEMEDGSAYLDHLKGPFFDYILDHPLFHYNGLMTKAENMHVIVLDEAQRTYIERYHRNVKRVYMLPLGATEAFCQTEKQKPDSILFLGTYERPDKVYELVRESPEPMKHVMKSLIDRRLADPLLPMEEAYRQYLAEHEWELADREFVLFMNAMYPVDAFIRDYFRKAALDELIAENIPVKAVGEGWEKYQRDDNAFFKREKSVLFQRSFDRIAREQILLNVSPIFNRGLHDRVLAGMANRTAVLTDGNPYLEAHFCHGENICLYSLASLHTLSDLAGELMENRFLREKIQNQGLEEFRRKHTWEHRARQILDWAEEAVYQNAAGTEEEGLAVCG